MDSVRPARGRGREGGQIPGERDMEKEKGRWRQDERRVENKGLYQGRSL